ncbi:MAG: phospho-N-acetylmuramoyl-pentapeptide-transferase [Chloroflexi bacterium]|nr:phospho-N-acetylmuramoyl-pentapeptide-transferase [Chloroflexota bacterium]
MPTASLPLILTASGLTFLLGVIWGGPFIEILRRLRMGKNIQAELSEEHQKKKGTPTTGGIMIIASTTVVLLALNAASILRGGPGSSILVPLVVMIGFAILGWIDDMSGIRMSRGIVGQGISARAKLLGQLVLAGGAAVIISLYEGGFAGANQISLPLIPLTLTVPPWLFIPLTVFLIMASANAVNFTDGLDGLAGIISASAFAAYGIIAYLQGQVYVTQLCFVLMGACFAFLWFNAFPAHLIMGDTGSMALGSTLGLVSVMTGQWVLLPVIAIVPVAETISVILQIWYFKSTGGQRLFRMAPLHLHYQRGGWSETQVVQRFWLVGLLSAIIGVALALL